MFLMLVFINLSMIQKRQCGMV